MELTIPDPSLVVLVGVTGSGKSTFAARRFRAHEVVSSDHCRELVAGDAADQAATGSAFSLLAILVDKRLKRRLLTLVDATNVTGRDRRRLVGQARRHGVPAVAVVLDLPLGVCRRRNARRAGRTVDAAVLDRQHAQLRAGLARLPDEGFLAFFVLHAPDLVDRAVVVRVPQDVGAAGPGRRPQDPTTPAPRRPAALLDLDSVDPSASGLPALLTGLAGRIDVVAVTSRPAARNAVSEALDEAGVVVEALLAAVPGEGEERADAVRRLLADEVLPAWHPLVGVTGDPTVACVWRTAGVTVLRADPSPSPGGSGASGPAAF